MRELKAAVAIGILTIGIATAQTAMTDADMKAEQFAVDSLEFIETPMIDRSTLPVDNKPETYSEPELPSWGSRDSEINGTVERQGNAISGMWPSARLYEVKQQVTVTNGDPIVSKAEEGYEYLLSRYGNTIRFREGSKVIGEFTIIDDMSLAESNGRMVPAIRAMRTLASGRVEQLILTDNTLTSVRTGYRTGDVIVTYATRFTQLAMAQ